MKLAHLILAHNNPLQLARLVNRLAHEDADVYIHLDLKTEMGPFVAIGSLMNTHFIVNRENVAWCEYSAITATLNGLEEILATGTVYSHINIISGNDYPLKSANEIQDFFFANIGKTFMWYDKIPDNWVAGQARIHTYYFGDYGFTGRYHLGVLANKLLPKRQFPKGLTPYGRTEWLALTPEAAAYTLQYIKTHPAIQRYFRMTWAVDEVFFQTILCNSPLRETIENRFLHYLVLNEIYRPITFTMAHAADLAASGKLFARKFDMTVSPEILDYLDRTSG